MAEEKGRGTVAQLLDFAGERRSLTIVGCALSAVAMAVNMVPYVCVWLVIAHRMRTVMGADRVVVLEGGRVTERGTPTELLAADGTFARMVRLQSEGAGWSV